MSYLFEEVNNEIIISIGLHKVPEWWPTVHC